MTCLNPLTTLTAVALRDGQTARSRKADTKLLPEMGTSE
jgi:hypothetical protein